MTARRAGARPGAQVPTPDDSGKTMDQAMWPRHCVTGSKGWDFHPKLNLEASDIVQRKG